MSRVEGYGFSPLALGCEGAEAVLTRWEQDTLMGRSTTLILLLILILILILSLSGRAFSALSPAQETVTFSSSSSSQYMSSVFSGGRYRAPRFEK